MMLNGSKILLGVCGSIAAYKSAYLVRRFVEQGAEVKVIMTEAATDFISPLTLSTLSRNPVLSAFSDEDQSWENHVELGKWADLMIIAPVTANTLAKMANGLCDNLLMAVYLSSNAPLYFAPAMDLDMWKHPATQQNIKTLQANGNHLIDVGSGELASGLVGEGRLAEPDEIVEILGKAIKKKPQANILEGKKALVTAGPTHEAIDPVRFIGNRSSGKMGIALAEALAEQGVRVILVKGPSKLEAKNPNIETIQVTSADEMYQACMDCFDEIDIAILAAAVADYAPEETAAKKIKKQEANMSIQLTKTKDILKTLGQRKTDEQVLVGFALETDNELANARKKLKDKKLDLIVLNSLADPGAGFEHDTNKVTLIDRNQQETSYELKAKSSVARDIVKHISELIHA